MLDDIINRRAATTPRAFEGPAGFVDEALIKMLELVGTARWRVGSDHLSALATQLGIKTKRPRVSAAVPVRQTAARWSLVFAGDVGEEIAIRVDDLLFGLLVRLRGGTIALALDIGREGRTEDAEGHLRIPITAPLAVAGVAGS